jgi:hypothetical protein
MKEINFELGRLHDLIIKLKEEKKEMKNEIQAVLDSPITNWVELHEAIQDILNKY